MIKTKKTQLTLSFPETDRKYKKELLRMKQEENVNVSSLTEPIDIDFHSVILSGSEANIMLVDSYINIDHDFSYYGDWCEILQNDRFSEDPQYISSLWINCSDYYGHLSYYNNSSVQNNV